MKNIIILVIVLMSTVAISCKKDDDKLVININDPIAQYIFDNPENSSMFLLQDSKILVDNADRMMPLASTLKIIICIEYAEQCAAGIIDSEELVDTDEILNYYIEDGDLAAELWYNEIEDKIINNMISINEVAKGMIKYSANANTEWLTDKLGIDNVNDRIRKLGIENHDPITYLVSSMFVADELASSRNNLVSDITNLSIEEYYTLCNDIHEKLKAGFIDEYEQLSFQDIELQKIWSDRLPNSTTREYAMLMNKINNRTFLSQEVHKYLDPIMEWSMDEDPATSDLYKHFGYKGGSTASVFTWALYAENLDGKKIEYVFFLNNLSYLKNLELQSSLSDFNEKVLSDQKFRDELTKLFK
jgi:D-alanyl-D-alanine carboxypeptidase